MVDPQKINVPLWLRFLAQHFMVIAKIKLNLCAMELRISIA